MPAWLPAPIVADDYVDSKSARLYLVLIIIAVILPDFKQQLFPISVKCAFNFRILVTQRLLVYSF